MTTQSDPTTAQTPAAASSPALASPNQYHFSGGGLTISCYPVGFGPITTAGPTELVYQDSYRSLRFSADQVRTVEVTDLGTLVSVTIQETVDVGSTSVTLIIPAIRLPTGSGGAAPMTTDAITTTHRTSIAGPIGHVQSDTYVVTHLTGTASRADLPR